MKNVTKEEQRQIRIEKLTDNRDSCLHSILRYAKSIERDALLIRELDQELAKYFDDTATIEADKKQGPSIGRTRI